jgi:hypothetical protein
MISNNMICQLFRAMLCGGLIVCGFVPAVRGQQVAGSQDRERAAEASSPQLPEAEHKRILWIIPNYRTFPSLKDYKPLTTAEKFKIAQQDTLDRGTFALAAAFAGLGQLTNANRSFGQGVAGYARYFGTSYADLAIGNYMTEAFYPTLLHQDPRYFRRGTGSGMSRLGYAVKQIFWTHTDSGGTQFNFSEIGGNATASAIATAYYQDNRDAASAASKLGIQIAVDTTGNILKEFWPDITRKLARKKHSAQGVR